MNNMYPRIAFIGLLLGLILSPRANAKSFDWDPITPEDWLVREDSSLTFKGAVMIFERIEADDKYYMDDRCYYTIYRRIRVVNGEGRSQGDVVVPIFNANQEVRDIEGRTILQDGTIHKLTKKQIFEKELVKTRRSKIKQKSFSMPGMTDDCIIEYYIKLRLPSPPKNWLIQKEIFVNKATFTWKFYQGPLIGGNPFGDLIGGLSPNYLLLNTQKELDVTFLPSIKEPEEVVFEVQDVSPFSPEPYTLPDVALKAKVRMYYGSHGSPEAYWGNVNTSALKYLDEYTNKNKRVRKLVKEFENLKDDKAKMKAAYNYVQENILNLGYSAEEGVKYKDRDHVDDILKYGYGSMTELNILFYDMLREMNIDAKLVFVVDRNDNYFAYQAKYWQFDRSLVVVPKDLENYDFFNAGGKYLPFGEVAWINEGTVGFLIGDMNRQFISVPTSPSNMTKVRRFYLFELTDDFELNGAISETHTGHSARSLRLQLEDMEENEVLESLKDRFSSQFPERESDSIRVRGIENINHPVGINYYLSEIEAGQKLGSRYIIKPYELMEHEKYPFDDEERNFQFIFNFAYESLDILTIQLPDGWEVEALPADSAIISSIGRSQVMFKYYKTENKLSFQQIFRLNSPIWDIEAYDPIKELFKNRQEIEDLTIVLKKSEPKVGAAVETGTID